MCSANPLCYADGNAVMPADVDSSNSMLQEEATMQMSGHPADSIESTYSMEYQLVRYPAGWKLSSSATTV